MKIMVTVEPANSSWFLLSNHLSCSLIVIAVFSVIYLYFTVRSRTKKSTEFDSCSSPDCVRCSKYKLLTAKLSANMEDYLQNIGGREHLTRVISGVRCQAEGPENITDDCERLLYQQHPSVFRLPAIKASPWHTETCEFKEDVWRLEHHYSEILGEFEDAYSDLCLGEPKGWLSNSTPSGQWSVFHLLNQGVWHPDNCDRCPVTVATLRALNALMTGNVFGNASFSVLEPQTHISEHYGPTNVRIRCHLGLLIPQDDRCKLGVRQQWYAWREKRCILFDDSFLHEAQHDGNEEDGPRAVLFLDFWHPEITVQEKLALNHLFSSQLL